MPELDVVESKSSLPASNYYSQIMKSYIWLQTVDGSLQEVEQEVATFCPVICREIHAGKGTSKNHAICLPQRVNPAMLSLILDYCRFHQVPGHSNKERKCFDEKFIRMDTKRLCELASASDSLQLKPLVELTSRALARMIEGKTPEEIREIFCLPDDLTEEEKLEPLRNMTDDPRIRLLNRLYAKRRKELQEKQKMKTAEVEEMHGDDRSLDDLLSFINGCDEVGGKFPASQVGEKELKSFRRKEQKEMLDILDTYLSICTQFGARAEKIHIETDSTVEEGLVELISQQKIRKLVMGAAADRLYSRKMVEPRSRKASYVRDHAPDYCHIWFVCKGCLIFTREAAKNPISSIEKPPNTSDINGSDAGSPSQDLVSRFRYFDFDGYEATSGGCERSKVCLSPSPVHSEEAEQVFSTPQRTFGSGDAAEAGSELLALPQSFDKHLHFSPASVLESCKTDDLYGQLEHAMIEAENSRREAFEESMKRRKAEKEALDAIRKAKTAERLYHERLKLRKAAEEKLGKVKEELENTKNHWIKISQELHETMDQKLSLETQIEESNRCVKELEDKMLSAVELLQKYKNERDKLQIDRDNALREAEKLSKESTQEPSSSHIPVFFSELSFSELEEATNCFDPSLKIGEGGYGNIYKGVLRQTEVAIKILNPNSRQGPREFDQEISSFGNRLYVDVLSKLRHPNMVTLIGACPASWALVYEYLPGGSLEDRLTCKDNAPPLPWQARIRIATELCSVLIFLHSSRPRRVIHGDLKPANIILDDNFVSKLSDFGICHVVSNGETSPEQTTLAFTTEPKGTHTYVDPVFLSTGELTPYSFGILLLRILTGRSPFGIANEVEYALTKGSLDTLLDPSGGDWPFVQAEQLARMALRCCDKNRKNHPVLATDVWRVLEPMKASCQSLSTLRTASFNQAPTYFMCPIFQELMKDPHIAADGFTYEVEDIQGWLDSGHDSSPMTNAKLANHNITPNLALRSAIQEWLQQHPST